MEENNDRRSNAVWLLFILLTILCIAQINISWAREVVLNPTGRDIELSSLLKISDSRITAECIVVIKAQQFRTQEKNRQDGLRRLVELIRCACVVPKKRRATRPTLASKKRRLDKKSQRGQIKKNRGRVDY